MRRLICRSSTALVLTGMTLFVSRAHAQELPPTGAQSVMPPVEDGDARELLRKVQEQQKKLDEDQKKLNEEQKKLVEQQRSIDDEQKSIAALIRELEGLVGGSTPPTTSNDARRMAPSTATPASGASPASSTV